MMATLLRRPGARLLVLASLVVLATLVLSLAMQASPQQQRLQRMDNETSMRLQALSRQLDMLARQQGQLPADRQALLASTDPTLLEAADGTPVEYTPTGPQRYRLCARFALASDSGQRPLPDPWRHGPGRQCFERRVDEAD